MSNFIVTYINNNDVLMSENMLTPTFITIIIWL